MNKVLAIALLAFPAAALAQQKAPIAQYWMSVETSAGMNMGPSLPLETPQAAARTPSERGELPKGRWLIYWGCGESVRAGQPVVVDLANLAQGQLPAGFTSRRAGYGAPPSGRTIGYWPNQQQTKPVPDGASLVGEHTVRGNYTPDIRFSLSQGQDFMDRVELTSAASSGGGTTLQWNAVGNATGYSAVSMGREGNDTILWSSSEVQTWGWELMDWLAPAEVTRLIREKVVMSPQTTDCTVPVEIVKKSGTPMAMFVAYGPEANFGFPPRPQDPQWYAKVRFKSTAQALLGDGGSRGRGRTQQRAEQPSQPSGEQSAEQQPSAPNPVRDGVNILRGIFGR